MSIEDRLRDALRSEGDAVEPAPNAWGRLQSRFRETVPRNRRRWPIAVAIAGAVAVAGVVAAVIVDDDETGPRVETPASTPGETAMPSEIVAIRDDNLIVVLSSEDGSELHAIAPGVEVSAGLAVAADGTRFYAESVGPTCDADADGEIEVIGTHLVGRRPSGEQVLSMQMVRDPVVSPDGRYLAVTGLPDCSDAGNAIIVVEIASAETGEWTWLRADEIQDIELLGWAADSRHLMYVLPDAPDGAYPRIIDTQTESSLDDAARVDIPDGRIVDGYLGRTGELVGVEGVSSLEVPEGELAAGYTPVVSFDAASGAVRRQLFVLPGDFPGASVESDATGKHVIGIDRDGGLYRWSEGEAEPTLVANGIVAAAWDPTSAGRPPTTTVPPTTGSPNLLTCGRDVPFVATVLPEGFFEEPFEGQAPGVRRAEVTPAIVSYSDGAGRSIEVHHPGSQFVEILGEDDDFPNATVLGRPGTLAPVAPTATEPLLLTFEYPTADGEPCSRWSLDGYGVTEGELRVFAEGLVAR
jgi:hypothetical protein